MQPHRQQNYAMSLNFCWWLYRAGLKSTVHIKYYCPSHIFGYLWFISCCRRGIIMVLVPSRKTASSIIICWEGIFLSSNVTLSMARSFYIHGAWFIYSGIYLFGSVYLSTPSVAQRLMHNDIISLKNKNTTSFISFCSRSNEAITITIITIPNTSTGAIPYLVVRLRVSWNKRQNCELIIAVHNKDSRKWLLGEWTQYKEKL